ncbi:MAG: zinc ribbon domain-containing protein [Deltaproteobacteria bacterium]|nr:zinc ribbon domain-containing protein [Deltaproteobacteria bacterium]MBW2123331.1 zinc ribbon domain-containing protein [Deltaproteobacteria bacterium]
MPVYEYQCVVCGKIFEVLHGIHEDYKADCPSCHGRVKRILSPSNFILKGAGFYVNDYPSETRRKAESKEKHPEKPAGAPGGDNKAEKQA